jgi:LPS export ABC transporter protein LptC
LGGVGYKVYDIIRGAQGQIKKNPLKALEYLPESALQMKDFHRAKIENGRKIWELYGDEASYFKDQKEAVIKKPKFYYYDREGEAIETNANEARIYLNEKELDRMELRGAIQVSFQGYVLNRKKRITFRQGSNRSADAD